MADSIEIRTMRAMEWERVKGSIRAILAAYWDWDQTRDPSEDLSWKDLNTLAEDFILAFGEAAGID